MLAFQNVISILNEGLMPDCSMEHHYHPVDTGRKLNVLDVFWTSYVRSIYVLCLLAIICRFRNYFFYSSYNVDTNFLFTSLQ